MWDVYIFGNIERYRLGGLGISSKVGTLWLGSGVSCEGSEQGKALPPRHLHTYLGILTPQIINNQKKREKKKKKEKKKLVLEDRVHRE